MKQKCEDSEHGEHCCHPYKDDDDRCCWCGDLFMTFGRLSCTLYTEHGPKLREGLIKTEAK